MKTKFRCGLLALLLLGSSVSTFAGNGTGLNRNQWDFGPEICLSNPLYALALGEAMPYVYNEDRPFWAPNFIYKKYITSPGFLFSIGKYDRSQKKVVGKLTGAEKYPGFLDPDLKNISIGYGVNFMSKEYPFGFSAKIAYEQVGWDVTMNNDDGVMGEYKFRKQMIVPEVLLKLRLGSYRRWAMNFCLEAGASYDYAVGAKCLDYSGSETVNSGFTGIVGISLGGPESHLQVGINYYMPTYNYYNREFTPDGGVTYPLNTRYHNTQAWSLYARLGF